MEETASPWAARRKSLILTAMVLLLSASAFYIFWKFWYTAPTCFDNVQNGDEMGKDCGGSCSLVCSDSISQPIVRWDPRLFEVVPGNWSAIVYVENPNTNAEAVYAPYKLTIYGEKNEVVEERTGATILPRNKTVGIFEGAIMAKDGVKPKRALFEIGEHIKWERTIVSQPDMTVTHSPLLRLDTAPRIEANVKNNGIEDIKNIELVVAIFDGSDNVIAASRTFLENLKKDENANVFFTWPRPFELGEKVCETPSNVALLLDRSGSMASIKRDPPEPLTEAKAAAASFVNQLGAKDKVSLISFATNAKNPIDLFLTNDFATATKAIEAVSIENGVTQYTNIFDALHAAWGELVTARVTEGGSKIIILLTDGVATNPKSPNGRTEADDIQYAEEVARGEAINIKKEGIQIYTIGLGGSVSEAFLKDIASSEANYFFAPSAENLGNIYENISSNICKEIPARIEITYKVFGDLAE